MEPVVFKNTELIHNNRIASMIAGLGPYWKRGIGIDCFYPYSIPPHYFYWCGIGCRLDERGYIFSSYKIGYFRKGGWRTTFYLCAVSFYFLYCIAYYLQERGNGFGKNSIHKK